MGKVDDLNAALQGLGAAVTAQHAAIQNEIAALEAAMKNDDTDAVEAAITNIKDATSKLADDTAALLASAPPPAQTGAVSPPASPPPSPPAESPPTDPSAPPATSQPAADEAPPA